MIRFLDITISTIGIIVTIPFFLIISLCIAFSSRGPIFFRQQRIGMNSKPFMLYKFRTMYVNTEHLGQLTTSTQDKRITPVGKFLRKYKLDELPQLYNVMKGDMSMVGPRPEVLKFVSLYSEEQKFVLSVKPGITDHASVYYRNESELLEKQDNPERYYTDIIMPEKIRINKEYILNKNLKTYFAILFKTLKSLLNRK